jgi:hypothetical protein
MSLTLHDVAVPSLTRALKQLSHILQKGEAYARETGTDPSELINARLAIDMLPLSGQVQRVSDSCKGCLARLSGQTPPSFADEETTFAELQDRVARTLAYVQSVSAEALDGPDDRPIELKLPQGAMTFPARDFLLGFALPNVYFHVTTAYDILRHKGVPLKKTDYLSGS